jgi:hypothetical protein
VLAEQYRIAQRQPQAEVLFFKESGRFPLGAVGKINTYAVFADLFRQCVHPKGRVAFLVPNGLVTGFTYRAFLRYLLESKRLVSFFGFENEDKIFQEVHNETKFGIVTVAGADSPVDRPWLTAHIRRPDQIHNPLHRYSLSAGQIEAINPNTLNLPAFRWTKDAEIAAAIHSSAPVLIRRGENGDIEKNPWGLAFRQLFNMATDSVVFIDHAEITPRIMERRGPLAVLHDGSEVYPLCEGKMLWHFDHRYGTYAGQTEKQANKGVLPHVGDTEHDDPNYRIQPRYWVEEKNLREVLGKEFNREWFFAWRDVGPTERTFVGSVIPKTAAGHKAPLMFSHLNARTFAALIGILSSLVVDYDARQRSNGMSFFLVEQLAVPAPERLEEYELWLGQSIRDWLADRVLELSYTNIELTSFAREMGFCKSPFRWIPSRRAQLQAEIDAVVLHLYQLSRSQAEWVIESFTVLRKYEEREYHEYRTRRLVLEIFDAMFEARRTETKYQSQLNPPAADPSSCHVAQTVTSVVVA